MIKAALILSSFVFTLSLQSCNFDSCHEVVCSNGGVCVNGQCVCPNGFEGTDCDAASSYKFPGIWAAYDTSLYYFSASYLAKITTSTGSPTTILVSNLRNWGANIIFSFSADAQSITLNPSLQVQYIHTLISANGTLSADGKSLYITYTYHDAGDDTTVTGIWSLR